MSATLSGMPAQEMAYAISLQMAIEHHCRGVNVPEHIAKHCEHHAGKLNRALVLPVEPSPDPVQPDMANHISVQPQAEPVAEIIECSKMGQQTVKEIEGRWKFLDYGTKLYAGAAPVAQADTAMLDWLEQHDGEFHNIDRISSIVGTGFLTGPLNTSIKHQTLRAAIDAAMKGTP